jgi:ribosomal protein S18 acetylase RimI-like enzyme
MPIKIRRATAADEAAIDQWQQSMENLDEYLAVQVSDVRDPQAARQRFWDWLRQPRDRKVPTGWERIDLVAVEESGAICGYAVVNFGMHDPLTGQPEGYVSELHVWPEYRSRGVAAGLLEMAEAFAAQRGVPYLTLQVPATNQAAIQLYKNAGFKEETIKMVKRVSRTV